MISTAIMCSAGAWMMMVVGPSCALSYSMYQTEAECRIGAVKEINSFPPGIRCPWKCSHMEFACPHGKTAEELELK